MIGLIQKEENHLLAERTADLNYYGTLTPVVIILASLIALSITFVFYKRVKKDYEMRRVLQQQLETKDKEVSERIEIIENIASQIALGNYKVRLQEVNDDSLGKLSEALNKMATSLDVAFEDLLSRDWTKTGIATLSEKMVGENDLNKLCQTAVTFIAEYTKSITGAFYLMEKGSLHLKSGYALQRPALERSLGLGEGIAGQCAASGTSIIITDIPEQTVKLVYAAGEITPRSITAIPVFFERELKGVIELSSLNHYTNKEIDFLNAVAYNIGMAIENAQRRTRLLELFQETQAQAEELQSQHAELEQINTELEAQAQNCRYLKKN